MAIKDLLIKIGVRGSKKAEKSIGGLDKTFKGLASTALKIGSVFFAAKGIIIGLQKIIEVSGKMQSVRSGFDSLSSAVGMSSDTLSKLTQATNGTVSSLDLMTQANNALLLGVADSEEQMAEMFDIAQRLGAALGEDTLFGVESLVTGMGRQSKLMLDNLGIMVDVQKGNEEYATSIGKTANQLTDQEKKIAFNNATMKAAKLLVEGLGKEQLTTSDRIDQLKASGINLAGVLGDALTPAFNSSLTMMAGFTEQIAIGAAALGELDLKETGKSILENTDALLTAVRATFMNLVDSLDVVFGFIVHYFKKAMLGLLDMVKSVGEFLFTPIVAGALLISAKVNNVFIEMFNALTGLFNDFAETGLGERLGIEKIAPTDLIDEEQFKEMFAESGLVNLFGGEDAVNSLSDFTDIQKQIYLDYFDAVAVKATESSDKIVKAQGKVTKAVKTTGVATAKTTYSMKDFKKNVDLATHASIQQGASITSTTDAMFAAGEAARSVATTFVTAEIMKAVSTYIANFLKKTPLHPLIAAPLALAGGAAFGSLMGSAIQRIKFADGGIVPGQGNQDTVPAMLTPGEVVLNQAQQENLTGAMGGVTVNISGNVIGNQEFVRDILIPEIQQGLNLA